ncbi:MAG: M20/M25/M40 family metallo-hydrolase [Bacteriovoracaceae bacterium]|jgi:acetylornithine deacetylase/succinyl-diaminopimelate desuccinylase-like protein|nr:M20/M25/M40 family metallo-hydrolase [Bacteriovoracaceae bacterium]
MKVLVLSLLLIICSIQNSYAISPSERGERCFYSLAKIRPSASATFKITPAQLSTAEDAFKICLSEYLQIKTISPVGDEHLAVEFFETVFKGLNFPFKIYDVPSTVRANSTRVNILATLPVSKRLNNDNYRYDWTTRSDIKSIILNNHMDVVNAIPEQWEQEGLVFSGRIAPSLNFPNEDFIWGRGALDMKGVAIVQLLSMVLIDRLQVPIKKDIHFLAISDEEEGASGARGTLAEMTAGKKLHALSNATVMLGESGGMIEGLELKDNQEAGQLYKSDKSISLIGVEEKGTAWMKFKEESFINLLHGLNKLRVLDIKKKIKKIKKYRLLQNKNCRLVNAKTPNSKVNVVASKIIFKLHCSANINLTDQLFIAFTDGFKEVEFKSTRINEQLYNITLSTKSSSHGSIGLSQSVLDVFTAGLHRIRVIDLTNRGSKPKFYKTQSTETIDLFLDKMGELIPKLRFFNRFTWIKPLKRMILKMVSNEFGIDGLFRTKCEFTAFHYRSSNASALVDCRLLHTAKKGRSAKHFITEIKKHIKNPKLVIETMSLANVTTSSTKTEAYKIIEKSLIDKDENATIIPYMFPAGSDLRYFRNPELLGIKNLSAIPSYGVFPVKLNFELLKTMHGSNERFPVRQIKPAVEKYFEILKNLSIAKK